MTKMMALLIFNGNAFKCVSYVFNTTIKAVQEYYETLYKH